MSETRKVPSHQFESASKQQLIFHITLQTKPRCHFSSILYRPLNFHQNIPIQLEPPFLSSPKIETSVVVRPFENIFLRFWECLATLLKPSVYYGLSSFSFLPHMLSISVTAGIPLNLFPPIHLLNKAFLGRDVVIWDSFECVCLFVVFSFFNVSI